MAGEGIRVLCLNPSLDRFVKVDAVRAGAIHRVRLLASVPGGKALNVARTLATLNVPVHVIGLFGGSIGDLLRQDLEVAGISVDPVHGQHESRVSMSIWGEDDPELTEFYEEGVPVGQEVLAELRATFSAAREPGGWCVVSGSSPPDVEAADFVSMAVQAGAPTAIDLAGESLAAAVAHGPALIKINGFEAAELLGHPVLSVADAIAACERILERVDGSGSAAIVTLGTLGAAGVDQAGDRWSVGVPARGKYPVGSGDCFLGGMLAGLHAGDGFAESLAHAAAVAGANALTPGPGVFTTDELAQIRAEVDVTELPR